MAFGSPSTPHPQHVVRSLTIPLGRGIRQGSEIEELRAVRKRLVVQGQRTACSDAEHLREGAHGMAAGLRPDDTANAPMGASRAWNLVDLGRQRLRRWGCPITITRPGNCGPLRLLALSRASALQGWQTAFLDCQETHSNVGGSH